MLTRYIRIADHLTKNYNKIVKPLPNATIYKVIFPKRNSAEQSCVVIPSKTLNDINKPTFRQIEYITVSLNCNSYDHKRDELILDIDRVFETGLLVWTGALYGYIVYFIYTNL